VAWFFPTLELPPGNDDPMLPVDCFDIPFVSNFNHSIEDDLDMEESLSDGEIEDNTNMLRVSYIQMIHENLDDDNNNPQLLMENVLALSLAPEDKVLVTDSLEFEDSCNMLEDEEEEEVFTTKHTYFDLDENSMKIISFPDLKEKLENNVCCHICASKKQIGTFIVEQRTFKLTSLFHANTDMNLP